jgi:phosphoribosylanthranilate isomerase
MWVKICANTNLEDARTAAELGADAVGFVFAPSKRQVTPEQVAKITPHLPARVLSVGVFASTDAEEIAAGAGLAGLGAVQLHSRYDPVLVGAVIEKTRGALRLIQVVSIEVGAADSNEDVLLQRLEEPLTDARLRAVLLDAAQGGASGGLGRTFAWDRVAPLLQRAMQRAQRTHERAGSSMPYVILAGGLRPENVAEAIRVLRPTGVDVATGVEAAPGRKDPERVASFLAAARLR